MLADDIPLAAAGVVARAGAVEAEAHALLGLAVGQLDVDHPVGHALARDEVGVAHVIGGSEAAARATAAAA